MSINSPAEKDSNIDLSVVDADANSSDSFTDGSLNGWGTVLASFVIQAAAYGPIYSFGVLSSFLVEEGVGSSAIVGLIGSVGAACIPGLGVLSGGLSQRFGFRIMIFLGSLLMSVGIIAASFFKTVEMLIFWQGLVFGIGASFAYFPAVSLPSQWFTTNTGLATGVSVAGSGIGGLVWSIAIDRLLNNIGFEWTLRVSGLFVLVISLAVLPFVKTRLPTSQNIVIDISMLKDARFFGFFVSCFFANFGMFITVTYLPDYAFGRAGLDLSTGSNLLSIYNGVGALGRIISGFGADRVFGRCNSLVLAMWISTLSFYLWILAKDLNGLIVFAVVNGFVGGSFWCLFPVVLTDFFGSKNLVSLVGLLYTSDFVAILVSPPLAGYIKDHYSLDLMVIIAATVTLFAAISVTISRFIQSKKILVKI